MKSNYRKTGVLKYMTAIVIFCICNSETIKSADTSKTFVTVDKKFLLVTMRDGARLGTDIYLPRDSTEKLPVILIRTPTNKNNAGLIPYYFGSQGYVVAVQDVRGRYSSEGTWEPYINEGNDGYDTVEWLAKQDWCNGKIGMLGGSYMAYVQLLTAIKCPPHLKTIIPHNLPADPFRNAPFENGIFLLAPELWWLNIIENNVNTENPVDMGNAQRIKDDPNLYHLPVIEIDSLIMGRNIEYFKKWLTHSREDNFWKNISYTDKLKNIKIPVLLQTGWYDTHLIGTTRTWEYFKRYGKQYTWMIIGPWNHSNSIPPYPTIRKTGKEAGINFWDLYKKWFDYWLKGIDNKVEAEPKVKLFVANTQEWITSEDYPGSNTFYKKLFIDSNKGANSLNGDGVLAWMPNAGLKDFDTYLYNPEDPTPAFIYRNYRGRKISDGITSQRQDILIYETEKIPEDFTITGPICMHLFAETNVCDTDWFIYLYAINDEGEYIPLSHGCIRSRFYKGFKNSIKIREGKVYEYSINLWDISIRISKGWKLRLEITSADFPQYSRNLNTGRNNETETKGVVARQKIFHSEKYRSYLLLPMI